MKYLGCAYYPEYWGEERVERDAVLMRGAGIDIVRIGEFAWSRMEPAEGCYELGWLNHAVETLARHGIKVVMCTPSAAAPAWLVKKRPETLLVDKKGVRAWFGTRQHTCYTSPVYREYAAAIVGRLATEMARHPSVVAWQVDNEVGHSMYGNCHCEECQKAFRQWLRERYASVKALNEAWGAGFWSMDYSDWDEVSLGDFDMTLSSGHAQDSFRFYSQTKISYVMAQAEIIRHCHPGALVATNFFGGANHYEGNARLDRAGIDVYPRNEDWPKVALHSDFYRSMKPGVPFWVLETGIGEQGVAGVPNNDRLGTDLWHFVARGAELISIFRWRTCLSGQEKNLMGVLPHSGNPGHSYEALRRWAEELAPLKGRLEGLPLPKAEAAVVFDHECLWANSSGRIKSWMEYEEVVWGAHEKLSTLHITVDMIPPARPLDGYKLVVLSSMTHIGADFAARLGQFVSAGGVVLAMGATGVMDDNAKYLPFPGPERLGELLGVKLEDGIILNAGAEAWADVAGSLGGQDVAGRAAQWIGDAELAGGEALAVFANGTFKGQPAVVEKRTGRGTAFYLAATSVDDSVLTPLLTLACERAGVALPVGVPPAVEMVERGDLVFLINHASEPASFPWAKRGAVLVGGKLAAGMMALKPHGVCVISNSRQ